MPLEEPERSKLFQSCLGSWGFPQVPAETKGSATPPGTPKWANWPQATWVATRLPQDVMIQWQTHAIFLVDFLFAKSCRFGTHPKTRLPTSSLAGSATSGPVQTSGLDSDLWKHVDGWVPLKTNHPPSPPPAPAPAPATSAATTPTSTTTSTSTSTSDQRRHHPHLHHHHHHHH